MSEFREVRECSDPGLQAHLAVYCFDRSNTDRDRAFEAHLLDCDMCWDEIQRLERAVRVLRTDKRDTRQLLLRDLIALNGISSALEKPLAGHASFAWLAAIGLGAWYLLALLAEVAYAFDSMGKPMAILGTGLSAGVAACALGGLAADVKRTRRGRFDGLSGSVMLFVSASGLVLAAAWPLLPPEPIVQAGFQTFSARAGLVKAVCYFLFLSTTFVCIPFHFVVAMQRELLAGRSKLASDVLMRRGPVVLPKGKIFLSPAVLGVLLCLAVVVSGYGLSHLFDNLVPSPYMNMFMLFALARTGLFVIIAAAALWWYVRSINELRREALARTAADALPWPSSVQ